VLVLPKPFRRNIRIPISWFGCFDEPLMSIGGSAITPNRLLLVAGLGLFPTAIEGDPSGERARGTILTVSLSRSATLKAYRAGMDNIFGSVAARTDGGAFACGFLTMPFLTGGFGWLLRLDAGGTPIWERGLGEDAPDATVFFHRIIATSDGGAFASGFLDEGSAPTAMSSSPGRYAGFPTLRIR
jgi:hypothetical protein